MSCRLMFEIYNGCCYQIHYQVLYDKKVYNIMYNFSVIIEKILFLRCSINTPHTYITCYYYTDKKLHYKCRTQKISETPVMLASHTLGIKTK